MIKTNEIIESKNTNSKYTKRVGIKFHTWFPKMKKIEPLLKNKRKTYLAKTKKIKFKNHQNPLSKQQKNKRVCIQFHT